MTAGKLVDVYIDCNECGLRFFGSQAELLEGMTLRQVRRAARIRGWQTGVHRERSSPRAELPNSLLDYCPKDRTDKAT
jgi:hypothetical protein